MFRDSTMRRSTLRPGLAADRGGGRAMHADWRTEEDADALASAAFKSGLPPVRVSGAGGG